MGESLAFQSHRNVLKSDKDLIIHKQKLKKAAKMVELEPVAPTSPKTVHRVKFDDSLNQVHEVESYKAYNVLKDEEDCCEMLCQVQ